MEDQQLKHQILHRQVKGLVFQVTAGE